MLMLARLSFPGRWVDHMQLFGGGEGFLSEVFNEILDQVHDEFADGLLRNLPRYPSSNIGV